MYIENKPLINTGRMKSREQMWRLENVHAGDEWVDLHRIDLWKTNFFNELSEDIRFECELMSRIIQSL